jgi:hypothetical protein
MKTKMEAITRLFTAGPHEIGSLTTGLLLNLRAQANVKQGQRSPPFLLSTRPPSDDHQLLPSLAVPQPSHHLTMDPSLPPIPQPLTFEEPSPNPNAPPPPRPSSSRDPASSLSPPPSLPPPTTNKSRTVKLKTSNPLPAAVQETTLAESSEDDDDEEGADGGGGGSEGLFSHTVKPSRVQKIIKADKDIHACTKEAVFLIACATVRCSRWLPSLVKQRPSCSSFLSVYVC